MTLSFSWWYRAFVYFIADSSSGMHLSSLLKLVKDGHGDLRDTISFGHQLQTVLLVGAQQDDSLKTLFPATHLTLFCHTSLPDLLCPLHFPVRVLFKVETAHYWSYALLKTSRDYFVSPSTSTASRLAPPVSQWPKLVPLYSSSTWK